MSKYSFEFKRNVVAKHIYNHETFDQLARETGANDADISTWTYLYMDYGLKALVPKHRRSKYTLKFKLKVINYYLNHSEGLRPVAIHFHIHRSQVNNWYKIFENLGIKGLKPSPKGRPPKMKRKHIKNKQKLSLTERETCEDEILRLKAKLHRYRLDHIVLKTLAQMKSERIKKRHKR